MKRRFHQHLAPTLVAAIVSLISITAQADVTLPPVFSDHMVLQRGMKTPVWGTAAAGEKVAVIFGNQHLETTASPSGAWLVHLESLTAGGPHELTVRSGNTVTLKDVLVGDVWVGSGQSNMAGNVSTYAKTDPVLAKNAAAGPYAKLRLIKGKNAWVQATPQEINGFSALLFSFGLELQQKLDVPVGLMLGAVGGTPSGAWLSETALGNDTASQRLIAQYAATFDDTMKRHQVTLAAWEKQVQQAIKDNKPVPGKPRDPPPPGTANGNKPGYLYEAHIRHFIPYGIRGVLWDQGESGTAVGGVDQYTLMGALIRGWRNEWNQGDFPFIYVQKPSGMGCAWDKTNPVNTAADDFTALPASAPNDAASLSGGISVETHVRIMSYPNTGMAISSDLGPFTHPVNKSGYGVRAATVARGMVFKQDVEYYGPIYKSHSVDGGTVRVEFDHVGKGLAPAHSEQVQGFAIAGEDKVFHWADAKIDGNSIVLTSAKVAKPVAVRYAFAARRTWANLFNKDGLPAVTFRTDHW